MKVKKNGHKELEYYLNLNYPIRTIESEDGGYVVSVPDLPGCIVQVEDWNDIKREIDEVRKEWMITAYEDGVEIPLPESAKQYSGKFVLRISKSLHRELDMRSEEEGVSLNTLLVQIISQSIGRHRAELSVSERVSVNEKESEYQY